MRSQMHIFKRARFTLHSQVSSTESISHKGLFVHAGFALLRKTVCLCAEFVCAWVKAKPIWVWVLQLCAATCLSAFHGYET